MYDWMFYVNLGVQILIGVVLILIIRHKNSRIKTLEDNYSTLQSMIKLYNVDDFKKNVELKLENQQLQHQREIEKVFKESEKTVETTIKKLTEPWLANYNELLDYEIHFLRDADEKTLQTVFKFLPKNESFIRKQLELIKSGQLKPKN